MQGETLTLPADVRIVVYETAVDAVLALARSLVNPSSTRRSIFVHLYSTQQKSLLTAV